MNKLVKTVTDDSISYEFLSCLNGIIGLSERELRIFSALLDFQLKESPSGANRLSIDRTENRKKIMKEFNVSKDNLSRYIGRYKRMRIMQKNQYRANSIIKALIPDIIGGKTVQITLILKVI